MPVDFIIVPGRGELAIAEGDRESAAVLFLPNCHLHPAVLVAQMQAAVTQLVQERHLGLPPMHPLPETRVLDTVEPDAAPLAEPADA